MSAMCYTVVTIHVLAALFLARRHVLSGGDRRTTPSLDRAARTAAANLSRDGPPIPHRWLDRHQYTIDYWCTESLFSRLAPVEPRARQCRARHRDRDCCSAPRTGWVMVRIREPINALTHLLGAALAAIGLVVLLVNGAANDSARQVVAFAIFGASLILLYATSGIYHSLNLSEPIPRPVSLVFMRSGTCSSWREVLVTTGLCWRTCPTPYEGNHG